MTPAELTNDLIGIVGCTVCLVFLVLLLHVAAWVRP